VIPMKSCPRRRTHLGWFVPVIMVPECQAPGRTGRTVHGDSDAKLGGEWNGVLALGGFRDFGTEASRNQPPTTTVRDFTMTLHHRSGDRQTHMAFERGPDRQTHMAFERGPDV
jgi:hypothetical protein